MKKIIEDKRMFFVYTEGGGKHINTCYGMEELSKFLNRQGKRVENDLKKSRRKKLLINKIVLDKAKRKYTILNEKEQKDYMMIEGR